MKYKELEQYGNECIIYKIVSVIPIRNKYSVVVITRAEGGWIDKDNIDSNITLFNTEKEATEYYDSIK